MSRIKSGSSDNGQSGLMTFTHGFFKNVNPTPGPKDSSHEGFIWMSIIGKIPLDFKDPFILGLPKIQIKYLIGKNNMKNVQNPCDIPWAFVK